MATPNPKEVSRDTRMHMLTDQLSKPGGLKERAAQILLSEYSVRELGMALYMRCRRCIAKASSARHLVMGSAPGRPKKEQQREIDFRAAVQSMCEELAKDE